jgi:serine/threonine-protein kinase RsbW
MNHGRNSLEGSWSSYFIDVGGLRMEPEWKGQRQSGVVCDNLRPVSFSRSAPMLLKLEFSGELDNLAFVQAATDHVCRNAGFDRDVQDAVDLAIRESVINAIKHGNRNDAGKRVVLEFSTERLRDTIQLVITVRDQGAGFDPNAVSDPLAEENLLKTNGRGIFLIRRFMDDVDIQNIPDGGVEIRMTKRVPFNGVP